MADEAARVGAVINLGSTVSRIELGDSVKIAFIRNGAEETIEADHVWSTIPLTVLSKVMRPSAPAEVIAASDRISYRAMVLIYLVLDQAQWTPFDAHYFPEADIELTRLSEPKNYGNASEPAGRTVLCGELPCMVGDEIWNASDEDLGTRVKASLERCDLPIKSVVTRVVTKRLPFAYPIYLEGYEEPFRIQDEWAEDLDRVLSFGRQGLFAHDNTHHALAMAFGAVDCLRPDGVFDRDKWRSYRQEFAKHVVED